MDVYEVERTDKLEYCCDFESAIVIAHNERDAIRQIIEEPSFVDVRGVEPDGSNLMATLLAVKGQQIVMTRLSGGEHH